MSIALALRPTTEAALRGQPTCDLADAVALTRPDGPDGPSGQTLAARWARELRTLTASGREDVCVITEHWDAFDGSDGGFWTELDAAANGDVVFDRFRENSDIALIELPQR